MTTPAPTRRDWLKSAALLSAGAALPVPTFAAAAAAAEWTDRVPVQLKGLRVTCSEPRLVKRSRWFCWFPSLIRQPDGTLWAIMNAYADVHVSDSFSYLSRSRDGGLTWDEPRVIGDAGLNHLLLADGSAVVIPYYLRPRAAGRDPLRSQYRTQFTMHECACFSRSLLHLSQSCRTAEMPSAVRKPH